MPMSEDYFSLRVETTANLLEPGKLRRLLGTCLEFAQPTPNRWIHARGGPVEPIGPDSVGHAMTAMLGKDEPVEFFYTPPADQPVRHPAYSQAELRRMRRDECEHLLAETALHPNVLGNQYVLPGVHYSVEAVHVRTPEAQDALVQFGRRLLAATEGVYGHVDHNDWVQRRTRSWFTTTYHALPPCARALPGVYWANFFAAPYVSMFTAERLGSAPGCRVEWLDGGAALLLLDDAPRRRRWRDRSERHRDAVKDHLGREYFHDPSDDRAHRRPTPDFDLSQLPCPLRGFDQSSESHT